MDGYERVLGDGDYHTVLIDRDRKPSHCIFLGLGIGRSFVFRPVQSCNIY
jgi:hypothetical protein